MENPFLKVIKTRLERTPGQRWREYDLINSLVSDGVLANDYGATSLGLFQTHFLVKNALYHLQPVFLQMGMTLVIEPIHIYLEECGAEQPEQQSVSAAAAESPKVAEYYLDWSHFVQASEESVDSLLQSFWQRYIALDAKAEALALFDLDASATFPEIRRRYRQLAMQHHPDRGGCKNKIAELNQAMAVLQQCYRR